MRIFIPILAGATLRDRLIACVGALIGVALTGAVCGLTLGSGYDVPLIVAPLGASAVLLFAVPASPLAQPWPIIGGNTLSAFVGVIVARLVHDPVLATGLAVALAIAVMSVSRCLHPPGGAAALTAALAGPAVLDAGFMFPLVPVAINSLLLVTFGLCFHRLAGRGYPHVSTPLASAHGTADPPALVRVGFQLQDIDAALAELKETFDIDSADLDRVLREVEHQALLRQNQTLLCQDIMSRDVIVIDPDAETGAARQLLLDHNIRTLPVVDGNRRLLGTVGLRELSSGEGTVRDLLSQAPTAPPGSRALALLPTLTDGRSHAVVITDENAVVLGVITQTDLLAAIARLQVGAGGVAPSSIPSYDI